MFWSLCGLLPSANVLVTAKCVLVADKCQYVVG